MSDSLKQALPTEMPETALRVAMDVAAVGSGTALATIFGTLIIFVIPRLVSVEQFGYWRIFLLYTGYVGLLHLGFLEGALLSWGGESLSTIHQQLRPALKFVVLQQILITVMGALLCLVFLRPAFWLVFFGSTNLRHRAEHDWGIAFCVSGGEEVSDGRCSCLVSAWSLSCSRRRQPHREGGRLSGPDCFIYLGLDLPLDIPVAAPATAEPHFFLVSSCHRSAVHHLGLANNAVKSGVLHRSVG